MYTLQNWAPIFPSLRRGISAEGRTKREEEGEKRTDEENGVEVRVRREKGGRREAGEGKKKGTGLKDGLPLGEIHILNLVAVLGIKLPGKIIVPAERERRERVKK